jgi:hypothetical protein
VVGEEEVADIEVAEDDDDEDEEEEDAAAFAFAFFSAFFAFHCRFRSAHASLCPPCSQCTNWHSRLQ